MNNKIKKWIILEAKRVLVGGFGYCAVVKANPVREVFLTNGELASESFQPYENEDTQSFLIPEQSEYLEEIYPLARFQLPWKPNLADFTNDMVFDQLSQEVVRAYIHRSFDEIRGKEFKSNLVTQEKDAIEECIDSIIKYQEEHPNAAEENENGLPF